MNKKTTKKLETLADNIKSIIKELDTMASEEQRKYNNLPTGLKRTENGWNTLHNIDDLENATGYLGSAFNHIEDVLTRMNDE